MSTISITIDDKKKIYIFLLLALLGLLLFIPTAFSHSYIRTLDNLSDFHQHMVWAKALQKYGPDGIPSFVLAHSAWEYLLIFMNQAFGLSFARAGLLATTISTELTIFLLFLWYWPAFSKDGFPVGVILSVLGVSIATPISLLWPLDHLLYLGYIGINTYHNPTIILLKPFAILQFIYAYHCFSKMTAFKTWQIITAMLVSLLSTYIKPSLAICILPALGIFSLYRLLRKEHANIVALLFGIVLPAVLVLAWQFFVTYSNEDGGIEFLPFGVMSTFSNYLGLKFFLSILFPLAVLIVCLQQAKQDVRIVLGWLIFLFGAIFTYFFSEPQRLLEGNFGWSGEIALVLLFAVSTLFYLENPQKTLVARWLLGVFWSLHVVSGIIYYLVCLLNKPYA